MENRLYPTWEQLKEQNNPMTDGEKSLIKYLDDNLPKDHNWKPDTGLKNLKDYKGWLIFAQPFLNGSRPDVVIFNPQFGLVIYEVKDWDLENLKNGDDGRIFINNGTDEYPVKSPIDQVQYYKKKLIEQLVPKISDSILEKTKTIDVIKTGLYFHKAKTEFCQEKFKMQIKDFRNFFLFGYDSLTENLSNKVVPNLDTTGNFWDKEWNEEVLFWLIPPFHSIEQGTVLKLRGNQAKVAEPKSGHFRVRGVAGSGKTQVLAYRAGKLASEGYNVLIISYNITLWHYIKDMIARSPFAFSWRQFTFNHFHGFCRDILNDLNEEWPKKDGFSTEEFFKSVVPNAVIEAIKGGQQLKYDAILIDEGQDYHYEWYSMLDKYFLSSRDEVLIVCDKRQNIYEVELDWLDKRVNKSGLEKFKEPYIDLTVTFRLPKKVALISNDFSEIFGLSQELKVGKVEDNPVLLHSHHIVWLNIRVDDWRKLILYSFKRLKEEGYSPSDIVILLPNHELGKLAVDLFREYNIEVNHVFGRKRSFWMGDSRLKMSTIHSFKGWELLNIILFIPEKAPGSDTQLDAIVYTALTRTRENIIILNTNERYEEFGEKLPKKWNEQ